MSGRTPGAAALMAAAANWGARATIARPQNPLLLQRLLSTTSSQQAAHVVSFEKTSNPELDAVLDTIREKIILPSYIPHDQRKLLHKGSARKKLEGEPITLEIDGEVKRYRHMAFEQMPNTRAHFNRAVGLMRTPADFENLPRLYDGVVQQARRKLRRDDLVRAVRLAGQRGRIDQVFNMARAARRTGFRLDDHELVAQLLAQLQLHALRSGWDRGSTLWALRCAEAVLEMLETQAHAPPPIRGVVNPEHPQRVYPLARDPHFLAARLHLAAAAATQMKNSDVDVDVEAESAAEDAVVRYARDIVAVWPADAGLTRLHPDRAYQLRDELRYLRLPNARVLHASCMLRGVQLAAELIGGREPELAKELGVRAAAVERDLQEAMAQYRPGEKESRLGYVVYRQLFFPEENAAQGSATGEEA